MYLDLKPALSEQKLEEKFKREFIEYAKKDLKNYLYSLLPSSFVEFFMDHTGLKNKKIADMNKSDRESLINGLKKFDFSQIPCYNLHVRAICRQNCHAACSLTIQNQLVDIPIFRTSWPYKGDPHKWLQIAYI